MNKQNMGGTTTGRIVSSSPVFAQGPKTPEAARVVAAFTKPYTIKLSMGTGRWVVVEVASEELIASFRTKQLAEDFIKRLLKKGK